MVFAALSLKILCTARYEYSWFVLCSESSVLMRMWFKWICVRQPLSSLCGQLCWSKFSAFRNWRMRSVRLCCFKASQSYWAHRCQVCWPVSDKFTLRWIRSRLLSFSRRTKVLDPRGETETTLDGRIAVRDLGILYSVKAKQSWLSLGSHKISYRVAENL